MAFSIRSFFGKGEAGPDAGKPPAQGAQPPTSGADPSAPQAPNPFNNNWLFKPGAPEQSPASPFAVGGGAGSASLTVSDILPLLPPDVAKGTTLAANQPLHIPEDVLERSLSSGQPTLPLFEIYRVCPALFQTPISPHDPRQIPLPPQKIALLLAVRAGGGAPQAPPQSGLNPEWGQTSPFAFVPPPSSAFGEAPQGGNFFATPAPFTAPSAPAFGTSPFATAETSTGSPSYPPFAQPTAPPASLVSSPFSLAEPGPLANTPTFEANPFAASPFAQGGEPPLAPPAATPPMDSPFSGGSPFTSPVPESSPFAAPSAAPSGFGQGNIFQPAQTATGSASPFSALEPAKWGTAPPSGASPFAAPASSPFTPMAPMPVPPADPAPTTSAPVSRFTFGAAASSTSAPTTPPAFLFPSLSPTPETPASSPPSPFVPAAPSAPAFDPTPTETFPPAPEAKTGIAKKAFPFSAMDGPMVTAGAAPAQPVANPVSGDFGQSSPPPPAEASFQPSQTSTPAPTPIPAASPPIVAGETAGDPLPSAMDRILAWAEKTAQPPPSVVSAPTVQEGLAKPSPATSTTPDTMRLSLANLLKNCPQAGINADLIPGWIQVSLPMEPIKAQFAKGRVKVHLSEIIDGLEPNFRNLLEGVRTDTEVEVPPNEIFHALTAKGVTSLVEREAPLAPSSRNGMVESPAPVPAPPAPRAAPLQSTSVFTMEPPLEAPSESAKPALSAWPPAEEEASFAPAPPVVPPQAPAFTPATPVAEAPPVPETSNVFTPNPFTPAPMAPWMTESAPSATPPASIPQAPPPVSKVEPAPFFQPAPEAKVVIPPNPITGAAAFVSAAPVEPPPAPVSSTSTTSAPFRPTISQAEFAPQRNGKSGKQILLRALLNSATDLDPKGVLRQTSTQPGVSAVICLYDGREFFSCGDATPESEKFVRQASMLLNHIRSVIDLTGIGDTETFCMKGDERLMTFSFQGATIVCVLHDPRRQDAGLPEKITLVSRELAEMLRDSPPFA